jgi:hypothetical protein
LQLGVVHCLLGFKMINKENLINKKAQMSYTQILILIISMFAFSWMIYSSTEIVSAQGINDYVCCEQTQNGNTCQFVPSSECSGRTALTSCEQTSFCEQGCCYSPNTGLCSSNSPKGSCQGQWSNDASCNIVECQKGCCVLGNNALWGTERECEVETGFLGLETDFRTDINSEVECIFLSEKDDEGACFLNNDCRFITRGECSNRLGDFYKNTFCSDSSFESNCEARASKACVDGEDSVYWFDSCGNREGIAEECNLFDGTYCGIVNGNADCKSVDCVIDGKKRKNGESWCEYDGIIGNGKDVVGSRHVRHMCYMGEERIEPCEDYRNQICVQSDTDLGNRESFSEAACRVNQWRACLDYNIGTDKTKTKEKCEENPDCIMKGVNIDSFSFESCTPKYPPGFDLSNDGGGRNAEMICNMGSRNCVVIYSKKLTGWKCEENCHCEDQTFVQQMNDFCTSLGDCGGYVNIEGQATDDGYASNVGKIDLSQYKQYARNNPNQNPAEPGDPAFLMRGSGGYNPNDDGLKYASGAYGVGLIAGVLYYGHLTTGVISAVMQGALGGATAVYGPSALASFGNAAFAVASFLMVASIISMAFGMDYGDALAVTGAGAATYGVIAGGAKLGAGIDALIELLINPVFLVIIVIIYVVFELAGIGDTKKKVKTFSCMPWQPPTGGDDCSKCSNNPFDTPCTEYRCESLGQSCELINKGSGQEKCVDNSPTDVSSPKISPLFGGITEGYEYYNINNNGFEISETGGSCIDEFTKVEFGIKTDKPAQCKIGSNPLETYEQMPDYFGASNLYLTNHTNIMFMPSPEAFKNQYNLTNAQIKALGEIDFYVKCKSVNGIVNSASYTIKTCVKPGNDLTAPRIERANPASGSHVGYSQTEQELDIWVNEPSNCKYSVGDKDYDLMENSFNCQQDIEDYSLYGWNCNTNLILDDTNDFYIKCQDISDNKNTMTQSYAYSLKKSTSALNIDEIRPVDGSEIFSGVEPMTVELQVETSGGVNGEALCYYDFGNGEVMFRHTASNHHSQVFDRIVSGDYDVNIRCEDIAGDSAESSTSFKITVDNEGPKVIRMYYEDGIKITTNEQGECRYAFEQFDWENGTIMSGDGIEHVGEWQLRTYYIQCQDEYENKGGVVKVKSYSLV